MRILFLTNLLPYPLDNGGKMKSYTTIRALAEEGNEIHLICFNEDENCEDKKEIDLYCADIKQIPLKLTTATNKGYMIGIAIKSFFSRYSFGLLKYISKEMMEYLDELARNKTFDWIYIDHLQLCVYFKKLKRNWPSAKIVLDEHNCEYMIMSRSAKTATNILKKAFLLLETSKLKKFESKMVSSVDKVIVLSKEDLSMLNKISKKKIHTHIIPIGIQSPSEKIERGEDELEEVKILFVGTLSWAPNEDGVKWYMENVMPIMVKNYGKFKLFIVGKNPSENIRNMTYKYPNVIVTGYVETVLPYYRECDFMIVPLFVGSGQRVKIIEAFSYGMPVISTTIGAEGLRYNNEENILIANTADEFVTQSQKMRSGKIRKKISQKSKETFDEFYSIEAVKKLINNVLSDCEETIL